MPDDERGYAIGFGVGGLRYPVAGGRGGAEYSLTLKVFLEKGGGKSSVSSSYSGTYLLPRRGPRNKKKQEVAEIGYLP